DASSSSRPQARIVVERPALQGPSADGSATPCVPRLVPVDAAVGELDCGPLRDEESSSAAAGAVVADVAPLDRRLCAPGDRDPAAIDGLVVPYDAAPELQRPGRRLDEPTSHVAHAVPQDELLEPTAARDHEHGTGASARELRRGAVLEGAQGHRQ